MQETLERALAELDPHRPATAVAAGRTDSGVHAAGQVVHVDTAGPIPPQRWPAALNGRLPASIRVRAAAAVAPDWHACFSARYRRYRYQRLVAASQNRAIHYRFLPIPRRAPRARSNPQVMSHQLPAWQQSWSAHRELVRKWASSSPPLLSFLSPF